MFTILPNTINMEKSQWPPTPMKRPVFGWIIDRENFKYILSCYRPSPPQFCSPSFICSLLLTNLSCPNPTEKIIDTRTEPGQRWGFLLSLPQSTVKPSNCKGIPPPSCAPQLSSGKQETAWAVRILSQEIGLCCSGYLPLRFFLAIQHS